MAFPAVRSKQNDKVLRVRLNPRKTIWLMGATAAFLLGVDLVGVMSKYLWNDGGVHGWVPLFDMDEERNIPSLFSTLLILSCAFFFHLIAVARRRALRGRGHWMGLAGIFAFLSVDELVSLHERLIAPLRETLHTSGVFYFAWLIPYGIAVLAIGIAYLRFLFGLPSVTRRGMVIAGFVYLAGAIGMELIGGRYFELLGGRHNLSYELMTACEESLEMLGMIVLARALMAHLVIDHGGLCLLKIPGLRPIRLVIRHG